jgi:hypothetical protein
MAGIFSVMKDSSCAGENCLYYLVCETQKLVFSKDTIMFHCINNLFVAFSFLFNYTNHIHTAHLIHIYTILLHVSVYITPSSGRTYVFLTQNRLLFIVFVVEIQIQCPSIILLFLIPVYLYCEVILHVLAHSNWFFLKLVSKTLSLYVQKSNFLTQSIL